MALSFIDSIEIELTNHCNAKCIICPRDALTRPKGYMTWGTYKSVIIKALELNVKKIIFCGFGEPFLHKDILEYFSYLHKNAPGIELDIISNASLITPKIADALEMLDIADFVISFNGWDKESYEKIMVHLSFNKVMTNLKYITEHSKVLRDKIHFIPTQCKIFNEPEYKMMKDLLLGIGFVERNFVGCYPCINRAGYLNNPEVADHKITPSQEKNRLPADELMCTRFLNFLQIAWNGDIRLCYNDINSEAVLGNINSSSNEEIQDKILFFRDPKTKPLICQRCDDPILRGGFKHIK